MKPEFYCGLCKKYHYAIVNPCYFGIESQEFRGSNSK